MDLRDLTYFDTIAELGHLGRAAQKLNRSQPALSKSIQRLEESFGIKLFERDGRRIKLTPVGALLQQRGRQLQQSIAETHREVRDFASGVLGNIRLGCAATMAEHLLPQLTATLLERAPEITLNLVIGQDDMLRESLRSGRLDMVICPMFDGDPQLLPHGLFDDEAVVVASPDHPVFDGPIRMAELCAYRWVLPATSVSARRWIDNAFQAHELPLPSVQIETNSISLLPRLIAKTRLLSFLARETLEDVKGSTHLREVPLAATTMKRTIVVAVRAGAYLSPAAQTMLDILKRDGRSFFTARA
ncbi:LysR family transcriptional regulator [Pseudomonas chlororaphis]|jgi:DNA-binding transcriptional LysR family regulator|uniref:LysR family transcriptional regulator n=1 Tax=Pseudomonas morbosilactucae TaxID=2938197 RepID=A0ABT0JPK8_9PSED|nr:LysR family transcriptional regulator [Pseudomonas morbosilactucae]MCK9817689.1 LysR family transcriptional regulator [Pseudomonas morbosilactucae]ROL68991.1 LysR family transcriptional regulator [Pseudomonas chlororaphis]WEK11807.1 MAG: LysR family transcriptional regulator [Pseudomonas sp.]